MCTVRYSETQGPTEGMEMHPPLSSPSYVNMTLMFLFHLLHLKLDFPGGAGCRILVTTMYDHPSTS